MTYRVGHHSTSDDSARYREAAEIEEWKTLRDPVLRFKRWLEANKWWSEAEDEELRKGAREEVRGRNKRIRFPKCGALQSLCGANTLVEQPRELLDL